MIIHANLHISIENWLLVAMTFINKLLDEVKIQYDRLNATQKLRPAQFVTYEVAFIA